MRGLVLVALAALSCAACGDKITNIYGSGGSGAGGSSSSLATSAGAGGAGGGPSSTDATTGQGGATAGQGGASVTTGAGGAGGSGGDGQGGAGGCTPNGITCDSLPPGQCQDVDDGCGVVSCAKSCDNDQNLYCLPGTKLCDCQIATGYSDAVDKCPGSTPYFCGAGSADVPPDCADTGSKVFGDEVWCCQH